MSPYLQVPLRAQTLALLAFGFVKVLFIRDLRFSAEDDCRLSSDHSIQGRDSGQLIAVRREKGNFRPKQNLRLRDLAQVLAI